MIINLTLKKVSPFIPVASSAYGFTKTCFKVYNSATSTKALVSGFKGIIIDCTPVIIKYLLLCTGAIACVIATYITGDFNFAVGTFECCSALVKE